jgi:uncharacterized protein
MREPRRRVAIIGGGAAGLVTAWLLQWHHDVVLYEAAPHLGGHARSIEVTTPQGPVVAETGFKYFFDLSYPVLVALLRVLRVPLVRCESALTTVLDPREPPLVLPPRSVAQALRILRSPRAQATALAFGRFTRSGEALIDAEDWSLSLRAWCAREGVAPRFLEEFLLPVVAASWGAPLEIMPDFPAYSVFKVMRRGKGSIGYFYEIDGGASAYVAALVAALERVTLRPGAPVAALEREGARVAVVDGAGRRELYDEIVVATCSRHAARLLRGLPAAEALADAAAGFGHFDTRIVIHRDPTAMPPRREDWSVINVFRDGPSAWTTEWCGFRQRADVFRTWVPEGRPEPRAVVDRARFHHLVLTPSSRALQRRIAVHQGRAGVWLAGMYVADVDNHESAVASALPIARALAPRSPSLAALETAIARGSVPQRRGLAHAVA